MATDKLAAKLRQEGELLARQPEFAGVDLHEHSYIFKAADALEALEAEIKRLREALEPFAVFAEFVAGNHPGWDNDEFDIGPLFVGLVTMRDFRRARDLSRNRRETP